MALEEFVTFADDEVFVKTNCVPIVLLSLPITPPNPTVPAATPVTEPATVESEIIMTLLLVELPPKRPPVELPPVMAAFDELEVIVILPDAVPRNPTMPPVAPVPVTLPVLVEESTVRKKAPVAEPRMPPTLPEELLTVPELFALVIVRAAEEEPTSPPTPVAEPLMFPVLVQEVSAELVPAMSPAIPPTDPVPVITPEFVQLVSVDAAPVVTRPTIPPVVVRPVSVAEDEQVVMVEATSSPVIPPAREVAAVAVTVVVPVTDRFVRLVSAVKIPAIPPTFDAPEIVPFLKVRLDRVDPPAELPTIAP